MNAASAQMVWVPDNAPDGSGSSYFQGYKGGEYVSSPVTGKVIEYGTHERINVYTDKTEVVGYVVIEAINSECFTEDNVANNSGDTEDIDNAAAAEGLNLFYDEYEDTCAGFTITIDGFKVDLNTTDEEGNNGKYEQNEVVALYNSQEQEEREENEQKKEDAPFFVNYGESANLGSLPETYDGGMNDSSNGYYIKEGKYLGITYTDEESAALTIETEEPDSTEPEEPVEPDDGQNNPDNPEENPDDSNGGNSSNQEEHTGPANYIRIMVKDREYSIIDNVEDYFDIPEPGDEESVKRVDQEYEAWEGDLEVLAEAMHHEAGYDYLAALSQKFASDQAEADFEMYCNGYSMVNKVLEQNKQHYGYLYDESRTDMSPLVQVLTNQCEIWYASDVAAEALRVAQGGQGCYTSVELEYAEYCLTYDCTSVTKPYETPLGAYALSDGYSATERGTTIPRAMCQQGGYQDGAPGQSNIILVGFWDHNNNGEFDGGDELWGVDRSMESLIE